MKPSSEKPRNIIYLETERLLLRNLEPGDRGFLLRLWTDPEVTRYMGGPRDRATLSENIDDNIRHPYLEEYDLWVLTEKASGARIGHCGLLEKGVEGRREIEVIYVIAKNYWGRGYAGEIAGRLIEYAFAEKGLKRVIALIKPENKASQGVAEKCGMRYEQDVDRGEGVKTRLYAVNNRYRPEDC